MRAKPTLGKWTLIFGNPWVGTEDCLTEL